MESTSSLIEPDLSSFMPLGRPVCEGDAGCRVDLFLAREFRFHSRAEWQHELKRGQVRIDDRTMKSSYRLRIGDELMRFHSVENEPEANTDVRILWQQGDILAAYKPSPLPMHENGPYRTKTFAHVLNEIAGPEWGAVHRLDRETSGIVLCGRTSTMRAMLSKQFADNQIEKTYLAITFGETAQTKWTENRAIGEHASSKVRIKRGINPEGQSALTNFESLLTANNRSLVLAQPKTGRTGQIRIHLAATGHHLLGDILYHPVEDVFLNWWEQGRSAFVDEHVVSSRLCLHACQLRFINPESAQSVVIECDPSEDFWKWMPSGAQAWACSRNKKVIS